MSKQDKKVPEKKETPKPVEKKKTDTSTLTFGAALDKMVKKKEKDQN